MARYIDNVRTGHLFIGCPNVELDTENSKFNIDSDADHVSEVMAINSNIDVKAKNNETNIKFGKNTKTATKYHLINTTGNIQEEGCTTHISARDAPEASKKPKSAQSQEVSKPSNRDHKASGPTPTTRMKVTFEDQQCFRDNFNCELTVQQLIELVLKKFNVEQDACEYKLKCNGQFVDRKLSLNDANVCDSAVYIVKK